jgi:Predicted membrane protein (DUF2243)
MNTRDGAGFPIPAGILFGLGLGGFFDGIVLHQMLQWQHMLTDAGYPATSIENLKINTLWDGLFHATTYVSRQLVHPVRSIIHAGECSNGPARNENACGSTEMQKGALRPLRSAHTRYGTNSRRIPLSAKRASLGGQSRRPNVRPETEPPPGD